MKKLFNSWYLWFEFSYVACVFALDTKPNPKVAGSGGNVNVRV